MLTGIRILVALLSVTIAVFLSGCGPRVATRFDSAGDPLPPHAIMRLGTLHFLPEPSWTDVIQYSPDGTHLATAGYSGTGALHPQVHIWERKTGRDVTPAALKQVEATGIAWMPNGNRFVTSHAADNRWSGLRLWTVAHDNPTSLTRKDSGYLTVICAPTGDRIAARTEKEEIVVFNARGREEFRFPFTGDKKSYNVASVIDFSSDGKRLAVVSVSGIEIYDLGMQAVVNRIGADADYINCIRFLPDGQSVAIATDRGVRVTPIGSDDSAAKVFGHENVENVAISSDGRWLANSAFIGSGTGNVWDLRTGKGLCTLHVGIDGGIAFAPDNSELAVSTRRISFLETGTWKDRPTDEGHIADIAGGILVGNELWTGEFGPVIRKWSLGDGTSSEVCHRKSASTSAMVFIGEAEMAVAGLIPEIDILDTDSGKFMDSIDGGELATSALAYSSQHQRIISAGHDGVARGWDYDPESRTFSDVFEQSIGIQPARPQIAVSPNGEYFACGNALWGYVYLFRAVDGQRCWAADIAISRSLASPVAFTPDSKQVAAMVSSLDDVTNEFIKSVQFLECATGKRLSLLGCKASNITSIAISPDAQFAAVGVARYDYNNEIQMWLIPQSRRIATLTGHYEPACWLSFTPDGKQLISLSSDTGLVWDLKQVVKGD